MEKGTPKTLQERVQCELRRRKLPLERVTPTLIADVLEGFIRDNLEVVLIHLPEQEFRDLVSGALSMTEEAEDESEDETLRKEPLEQLIPDEPDDPDGDRKYDIENQ